MQPYPLPSPLSIIVTNVSKRFNREWIFRDLSFTFTGGNTYAVTGPNGSGKSTLLHILWGQVPPTSGELKYRYDDKPVEQENVFTKVSIATPYLDLIDEFTLAEQLRFHFALRQPRKGITADRLIEKMYLENAKDKIIGNFSSGMKQRLKLGLALYTESDVVFLDEPGTNLDSKAFSWYLEALRELPTRTLTVIASNQPAEFPSTAVIVDITTYK